MSDFGNNYEVDQEMEDQPRVNKSKRLSSRLFAKSAYTELIPNNDLELFELKLPSSLRIQPVKFEPITYEIEDPIVFKNDAGVLNERDCAVDNIVRYRLNGSNENAKNNSLNIETNKNVSLDLQYYDSSLD